MAASTFIKNNTMGSITLSDGTGTPVTLAVPFVNGDFALSGLVPDLREVAKYETKGALTSIAYTNRIYPSGSFSCKFAEFTDATNGTIIDFIRHTGAYSSNVSTQGSGTGLVKTIDLDFDIEGTDFGDDTDHSIALTDVRVTDIGYAQGDPDSLSISFEVLGTVTFS